MHETAEKLLSVHSELSLVLLQVTFLKGSKIVSLLYNKTLNHGGKTHDFYLRLHCIKTCSFHFQ